MMSNVEYVQSARTHRESARYYTRRCKIELARRRALRIDRTCVVVTALCNQPEAFASDLGDD